MNIRIKKTSPREYTCTTTYKGKRYKRVYVGFHYKDDVERRFKKFVLSGGKVTPDMF
jgi:hypothetical protein